MNKKIIVLGILIFLTGMFVSYSFSHMMNESNISKIIDNMTLEEKISQMLIVYYPSSKIDSYLENKLSSSPFGGFILANKNITDYESTRKFVSDLKSKSKYPLIISIDEEGGEVQRLKNLTDVEVSDIPSMRDIGNTNDERLSHDIGTLMAEELRTIGVNVVYGPVLDISDDSSFIGKRSFSNNSEVVSKMSLSFSKGLEQNKVIPVYKHFPGYGSTTIDSHLNLPVINKSLDELMNNDLIPFKNAINNDAKLIMVSVPNTKNWSYARHNAMKSFTEQEEIEFLDMNKLKDELKIDWNKETGDAGEHVNYQGALKVTKYLGKWLNDKKILENHKNDSDYDNWNKKD